MTSVIGQEKDLFRSCPTNAGYLIDLEAATAAEASPMTTCQMLAVKGAPDEDSEETETTEKSETLVIGKEEDLCRLLPLVQLHCERAVVREARMATISARTLLLGVRVDLRMDHDLLATNLPNALRLNDSQLRLSLITNGGPE